jgi:flagellar hook-associated protein 1 FlgK
MSSSTFGSFEIGRRALHVQQKGVQVTGQNIANANTEGYSRQVVHMQALVPPAVAGVETPPGYGVAVSDIVRMKSEFYGGQLMKALTAQSYWESLNKTTSGLEVIFQEPGEMGINAHLSEFFDAWQEVSVNPESFAARISLREQAVSLTMVVEDIYERMDDLKMEVLRETETNVNLINSVTREIAVLNGKITYLSALGKKSNEMLDQRDMLLQELSKLLDIRVIQKTNGSVEVLAGERILLHDDRFLKLEQKINDDTGDLEVFNELGAKLNVNGGELLGLLESYNRVLPKYMDALDELVYHLVEGVNELHRGGFSLNGETDINFFEPWKPKIDGEDGNEEENENGEITKDVFRGISSYFKVEKKILEDINLIAAAGFKDKVGEGIEDEPGGGENGVGDGDFTRPGDGSNALKIAQLRGELIRFGNGDATFHDFFRGSMTDLGVEGRESERLLLTMNEVVIRMREQEETVSSVSLDDEMLNMIQFQHAYNAASRYLSTLDRMLEMLIAELGR